MPNRANGHIGTCLQRKIFKSLLTSLSFEMGFSQSLGCVQISSGFELWPISSYCVRDYKPSIREVPNRASGHIGNCLQRKFFKSQLAYSANCTASFNPCALVVSRSGYVDSLPGPAKVINTSTIGIPKKLKSNKIGRAHVELQSLREIGYGGVGV